MLVESLVYSGVKYINTSDSITNVVTKEKSYTIRCKSWTSNKGMFAKNTTLYAVKGFTIDTTYYYLIDNHKAVCSPMSVFIQNTNRKGTLEENLIGQECIQVGDGAFGYIPNESFPKYYQAYFIVQALQQGKINFSADTVKLENYTDLNNFRASMRKRTK